RLGVFRSGTRRGVTGFEAHHDGRVSASLVGVGRGDSRACHARRFALSRRELPALPRGRCERRAKWTEPDRADVPAHQGHGKLPGFRERHHERRPRRLDQGQVAYSSDASEGRWADAAHRRSSQSRSRVRLLVEPQVVSAMRRAAVTLLFVASVSAGAQLSQQWPQHSMDRPRPPVVKPGAFEPAPPPSDAIVLFDGKSLGKWRSSDSTHGPAKWKIVDGAMEVAAGTGGIETRDAFGDCQLHIEWRAPPPAKGEGQERGNSGLFSIGMY